MKLLNTTLAGLILAGFSLTAHAEEKADNADKVDLEGAKVGHWTMDFEAATKLAGEKQLPLLLNFTGSDWCGWCKLMDKQVFAQEEWQKYAAENVVLVTLDFPNDKSIVPEKYVKRNIELKDQFGVRGYPTYVVLDSDAKTKLGQLGAGREKTPSSFIEEFKSVARMSEASIAAYSKANPDKAEAYKKAIAEATAANKALTDWIKTGPVRNEENNKKYGEFQARIKKAEEALKKF